MSNKSRVHESPVVKIHSQHMQNTQHTHRHIGVKKCCPTTAVVLVCCQPVALPAHTPVPAIVIHTAMFTSIVHTMLNPCRGRDQSA